MDFKTFVTDTSGAVAVDWVVLTGGLVGLGIAATLVVSGGMEDLSGDISVHLASIEVGQSDRDAGGDESAWGTLAQLNPWSDPVQMMQGYLDRANGDVQAAYDSLFADAQREALDPNMNSGNEIDALGAFEAHAQANNLRYDAGDNPDYATLHNTYTTTQTQSFF
ncbi:hypothetical protein [Roseicyclus marinus]|uniref:hypothetical protein n=1 Tax=Roseicyclus marinus TaxID=2161673 RepID=UPI00240EA51A|nr:hypothetical protein [Roseicyclus marinus]MDG3041838.1 hypothetical protein [Roseicyclus marinus]